MKAFIATITVALFLVFIVEADKTTFDKCKNDLEHTQHWRSWVFCEVPSNPFKLPPGLLDNMLENYDQKAKEMIVNNKKGWSRKRLTRQEINELVKFNKNLMQQTKERAIEVKAQVEDMIRDQVNKLNQLDQPDQLNQQ